MTTLTRYFNFSASYEESGKIYGHNYRLGVTMAWVPLPLEITITEQIEEGLIQKIHSRDFRLHTDWFAQDTIDDEKLLIKFSQIIKSCCPSTALKKLTLDRNQASITTLELNS